MVHSLTVSDGDLELFATFEALAEAGSVVAASRRLALSASATSRRLGRLRELFDDPLFVRAGQRLVPTPRALALAPEVRAVLDHARSVVGRARPRRWRRLTLRGEDGLIAMLAPRLRASVAAEAAPVAVRFVVEQADDESALRSGEIDLEIGGAPTAPEVRTRHLLDESFVLVTQPGPGPASLEALAALPHVVVRREGKPANPVDAALAERGLQRNVVLEVPGQLAAALMVTKGLGVSVLLAGFVRSVPELQLCMHPLPICLPPRRIVMAWHPRHDADPPHRWLRAQVLAAARAFER